MSSWHSDGQDGSSAGGVYAQRYNASGNRVGGEFQVNTYTTNNQYDSSIAMAPDGSFIITWVSDGQDGSGGGIYAQRYSASGQPIGGEFPVNSYTTDSQGYPSIATASDGSFIVTWDSIGQDGNGNGVYSQRYNASGSRVGGEFQVNTYTREVQSDSSIAMAPDGTFIIT